MSLYTAQTFSDAWEGLIRDWIGRHERGYILVASEGQRLCLKRQIATSGVGFMGVEIHTPGSLRKVLMEAMGVKKELLRREDLHVLLAANAKGSAVERDPGMLMEVLDSLGAGGQRGGVIGGEWGAIAEQFERMTEGSKWERVEWLDWELAGVASDASKRMDHLLVYGFSGRHMRYMGLLQAALRASKEVTVCILNNGGDQEVEQVFMGTLEEQLGSAQIISGEEGAFLGLSNAFLYPEFGYTGERPEMLTGSTLRDEVELITRRVTCILASDPESTVGIVVPAQDSVLGHLVLRRLKAVGVDAYDQIGRKATSPEIPLIEAWVEYQRRPYYSEFIAFLERLYGAGLIEYGFYEGLQTLLMEGLREVLTNDISVIFEWVQWKGLNAEELAFLKRWHVLPEESVFLDFLKQAGEVLRDYPEVTERGEGLGKLLGDLTLRRDSFLNWLLESCRSPGRIRAGVYYGNVVVLTKEDAFGGHFDHLFLTEGVGDNWGEGSHFGGILSNNSIRELNKAVIEQGMQGEGHLVLNDGVGWLLGSGERIELGLNQFAHLMQIPKGGLYLSSHERRTRGEDVPQHAYFSRTRSLLGLESSEQTYSFQGAGIKENAELLAVYERRRDESVPFDEYSFGTGRALASYGLTCKEWEYAFRIPQMVWLGRVLKLKGRMKDNFSSLRKLALGTWTHDWVSIFENSDELQLKPEGDMWLDSVEAKAGSQVERVRRAYGGAGRRLPDWYLSNWHDAKQTARRLAQVVLEDESLEYIVSEYKLPASARVRVGDVLDIEAKGRLDLVGSAAPVLGRLNCVIDFKTAATASLTPGSLRKGMGLQVVLYALALGGQSQTCRIVKPEGTSKPLQLDAIDTEPIWRVLSRIAETGVFGMRGVNGSRAGGLTSLPLACVDYDDEVLEEKLALLHSELK